MAQEWDIKPRGEACHRCEVPFEDQQVYLSALIHGEEGYTRADYCEACWRDKEDTVLPFSTWQGLYKVPPAAPEEALKKETAETLLRRLMEDGDEPRTNVIFILAVMLERKKLLVEKDVKQNDHGVLTRVYEHRKTGETFVVPDPKLRLDELETVQEEVVVMLGGKPRGASVESDESDESDSLDT